MRIQTKRTLQVALLSGGLLTVGTGSASAAETVDFGVPASSPDQPVTNPGLHGVADTVIGATDDLQAGQPVQQAATGVDLRQPIQALNAVLPAARQRPAPVTDAPAPAAVLHTVPVHLLQHDPAPSAEVSDDLPEQDLNAPLGSELAATDLPLLPAVVPPAATPDTVPDRATIVSADGRLPAMPTSDRRADAPAAGLPLLGGLLPSTNGVLPTRAPALNGLSDVTKLASLGGLTQLAGSTPLTHGGRYNTGAITAPLTQHGLGTLESATALLSE